MQDFYTSIEDAKIEIHKRWQDEGLRKEIEKFLGEDINYLFANGPRAILQQYVVTSGHDAARFVKLSKSVNLEPLCLDFSQDKFVTKNISKYLLGKLYFSDDFGFTNFTNIPYIQILNFNTEEGKRLCDVKTLWGQSLVEFHHDITEMTIPDLKGNIYDFSEWFYRTRHLTDCYYLYYLSLFICHGVLFENYTCEEDDYFTNEFFLPGFEKVKEKFGLKPLIHPLVPFESEDDFHWWCGPTQQIEIVKKYVKEKFNYDIHVK